MKIGIDARFVGPQGTGLGKYTEKLILNLAEIDTKNEYVIFLKEDNWQFLNLNKFKNFTKVLADVSWYSLQEQYKMAGIFKVQNLDLLHVPHFNVPIMYRGKFVVTIHDLIHHKFAEHTATTKNPLIFKIKRLGYKKIIEHAILNSKKIITPSNFVKDDILKNFKVEPSKIAVTYEAAEDEYLTKTRNLKLETRNYLLYVGNAYPHKNLNTLLDAMQTLDTKLIIVSPRDVFSSRLKEEIKNRNLESKVDLKGYMEPQELSKLFHTSTAYIFPTLSEGFGIPALNAMAAGLPVIASNIPVLKEIYGSAAVYFDPNRSEDIAEKISKVMTNTKTRINLVKEGLEQAKKYSWQKMA
ncbi:MAG TPA: glycosyltransferase family 1 protein, partial [Candidatus Saccharimonadales bacterium]|nr:glycosyltransferase family 1 protein [Candidatus Saccharimonadales bacterium]